jgi:hypothetical protein
MESTTVAWILLALGCLAATGAFAALKRRWSRTHLILMLMALLLIAAASAVLACGA